MFFPRELKFKGGGGLCTDSTDLIKCLFFRIKFKDPQYEDNYVFKAVILPGAKYVQTPSSLIRNYENLPKITAIQTISSLLKLDGGDLCKVSFCINLVVVVFNIVLHSTILMDYQPNSVHHYEFVPYFYQAIEWLLQIANQKWLAIFE